MAHAFIRKFLRLTQCVLVAALLLWPASAPSDQAQYFYDELGRLVGVVDGQGNVAVYNYDEVGNLLAIERFTTGTTGIGIFLLVPSSAIVGTDVEVRGFGFSATPADNTVAFNDTAATVVTASPNSIVATVPAGATTGPVTVTNANGTATSPGPFTVLVPPIIVGIDPDRVPQGVNTRAVISGFNLADATAVTFSQSGLSAGILPGATDLSLPINLVVAASVPVGEHAFSVTTPAGVAQSGTITVTVTAAVPSFTLTKASVFLPFPAQTAPSGSSMSVTPPVSVEAP